MLSERQKLASGNSFDSVTDCEIPSFLPLPELTMPLSQKRLLFNETHTASANRLYRFAEDKQLRVQFDYMHDRSTQQRGSDETYYFAQDTIRTVNNQDYRLETDCLNGELNFENNTEDSYTRENLTFTGAWKDGLSSVTGDEVISQRVKNSQLELKNYFSRLYTKEKYTWGSVLNLMIERNYADGMFLLSSSERKNTFRSYTLNTVLSKGVYDWNLKSSLELILSRNEGKQLNEGIIQDYRYDYLRAEPKIIWVPSSLFEAEYKATFSCGVSEIGEDTRLDPLWDISQQLTLSFGFHDTDIRLSGEHYYNDLSKTQHLNTWLADASLIHKAGKWRFTASVTNLFNKKQYGYTLYSAVQSYTSRVNLRSREFLVSVQYQW